MTVWCLPTFQVGGLGNISCNCDFNEKLNTDVFHFTAFRFYKQVIVKVSK